MRSTSWRSTTWLRLGLWPALAVLALSGALRADELKMAPAPEGSADRPTRGMSMERVEAKFGAPARRVPAIGEPPISRWEYPSFVVFFEHNLVIHSVVTS